MIRKYSSVEFVSHAKLLFKAWSVWLGTAGTAIGTFFLSFPDAAIQAWNFLPGDLKSVIPVNYMGFISYFMIAMGILSQFVRQKKLARQVQ